MIDAMYRLVGLGGFTQDDVTYDIYFGISVFQFFYENRDASCDLAIKKL